MVSLQRGARASGVLALLSGADGIDFLLGGAGPPGGGNAPVLFFWTVVLLALVALAGYTVWTRRRRVVWGLGVAGVGISILGLWSIGWYFMLPTLFVLVAAALLSADVWREEPRLA